MVNGPPFTFDAIGTQWAIDTPAPLSLDTQRQVLELVEDFDRTLSRFRTDSLVARMAAGGGSFTFPPHTLPLFELYDRLHAVTGGAVDPLVGGDLERLGYDRSYTLRPSPSGSGERRRWARDVQRSGTTLTTVQPLKLDFGAAGKGHLVDLITALLIRTGLTEFVVDGSGDLRHVGGTPLRVGLEHPFHLEQVIGVTELRNRALCASAVNRRAWGDGLHHVIDARRGQPTRGVVATWVIADDACTADGVATTLFFCEPDALAHLFPCSCVRMFADGRAEHSRNFTGELFTVQEV